ncbi:hypothetical protein FHS29_006924 [Saccharothrix tamanrassetensis]|uniref:Uncharacterized protein n=1 Tax=Saccharothrix tamanrassetensis TaxID=1051531 RepID=A0A841CRE6_9PSEU|nr:hypothetical protein [Saccharothrix tamanrassetensis]MBB5960301.1 hypothetical protein [Saccharothrix tamanrassetensis]
MKRFVVACLCVLATGCAARVDSSGAPGTPEPPVLSTTLSLPPTISEVPMPAKLSPHGKEVLSRARQNGATSVVLVLSTEAAATDRAASALRDLGATVEATDSSIGYIRASVPLDDVPRVAAVEGVRQVDVDEPIDRIEPTP